jgi:ubiquinol-cytochrome c reductase cytochrome b subunit
MSLWGLKVEPQMYNIYLLTILLIVIISFNKTSNISRLKGIYRIGPHNYEILSIIFGSLLGNGHAEKKLLGLGTRITFYQEASHLNYILYLHKIISDFGYCNTKIPEINTRLGIKGKIRKVVRFITWTYTSFNWIHELWYINNIKHIPKCIGDYLTPLALAIWIMDDGCKVNKGLKFCTNSYTYDDCLILVNALNQNFGIKSSIQGAGAPNQYIIYVWKESMDLLRNIVSPYIVKSMKYKINKV